MTPSEALSYSEMMRLLRESKPKKPDDEDLDHGEEDDRPARIKSEDDIAQDYGVRSYRNRL